MSRFELNLRVDSPSSRVHSLGDAVSTTSQAVRAEVYRKLGLKVHSNAWVTIDLSARSGPETMRRLLAECRTARAVIGSATVTERLDDVESAGADWFLLVTPTADNSFSLWDDYPCYRPGNLPKGHASNHTFVSADFVDTHRSLGLTGLSFLRCRNAGRKQVSPWFAALPDNFLGHGLDHPWFDRDRWVRDVGSHPARRSSSIDTAQYAFHQRWARADLAKRDPVVGPLFALFPQPSSGESTLAGLTIVTVPRYWARALPSADFAYLPWGEDGPNREGKIMRFRRLAVSARARAALIARRLVPEKALLAVRSVTSPEPGVATLDDRYPPDPPMYSQEELAVLRRREEELFPGPR